MPEEVGEWRTRPAYRPHRTPCSTSIIEAWQAGRFVHCTSEHIIRGTVAKLSVSGLRRLAGAEDGVRRLEAMLRGEAVVVAMPSEAVQPVSGDPEDDTVLATARLAQAGYLVTNDKGLLALDTYAGARIVRPWQFLDALGG